MPSRANREAVRFRSETLTCPIVCLRTVSKITFVTGNQGKLSEARERLEPLGFTVKSDARGYTEIQSDDLLSVCRFGLRELEGSLEAPFMLEDSGLFVDALDGFPGVYASFAYGTLGNDGILSLLRDVEERSARFRSVIGFQDGSDAVFLEGIVEGRIAHEKRGDAGFGFDPIFVPEGQERTFAEMTQAEKGRLSHRGQALDALVDHVNADGQG